MTDKAWKKVWALIGMAALLFGYAAVLRSRGVAMKSEILDVGSLLPDASSILSFVILAVLCWLTLLVTRRYALTKLDQPWSGRLPIFYFESDDIDVNTRDGKLFQYIIFGGLVIFPVVLLIVLYSSFLSYAAYDPAGAVYARGVQHLFPSAGPTIRDFFSGQFRYGATNGPSYYPIIQPWVYLASLFAILWHLFVTLRTLFQKPKLGST